MTPGPKNESEKPAQPESHELTTEGLEDAVGGITQSTQQPRLPQTQPTTPSPIAKVTIVPCV